MLKSYNFKKIVSLTLAAILVLSIGCLSASAYEMNDTRSRGYQLIDGDVYDLDGNLLIKLYDGRTADGFALDPEFAVYDAKDLERDVISTQATYDIYDGTKYLNKNTDGNQGVQVGINFTLTSSKTKVHLGYSSGEPSGVNFAVHNITQDTVAKWISNITAGDYRNPIIYNSARPDDTYMVKASAVDVSGNATLEIGRE